MDADIPAYLPFDQARRPGFEAAMRTELSQIIADPVFQNSPMLIKLLKYLVEETLAGRGDRIKAYSIAVDGLGRPPDFDAQNDSYPRVQVGRVRKGLATFYSKNAPKAGLCLYLQSGTYQVKMGGLSIAYPELFRPLSAASDPIPLATKEEEPYALEGVGGRRSTFLKIAGIIAATTLIAHALFLLVETRNEYFASKSQNIALVASTGESPILLLAPVTSRSDTQSSDLARATFAILADGLSRSWVAKVRADPPTQNGAQRPAVASAYKLETQIIEAGNGRHVLFARMLDASSGLMVWSTSISIESGSVPLTENLAPLISQIIGPFGAIVAQESRRLNGSFDAGYPCLLQFLGFLGSRDPSLEPKIANCLAQPIGETGLDATRLAFLSIFAISPGNVARDRPRAIRRAVFFARRAIIADPKEAYAHFAMAIMSFVAKDCETGARHSKLAVTANPFDPIILAVLGGLLSQCNQSEGLAMLEQAYRFYIPGESFARLSLILAQIQQRKFDRLTKLSEIREPQSGPSVAYYYLCETLISAAQDHHEAAVANWARFVDASPQPHSSIDGMLLAIIVSDDVRSNVITFLESKKVI